MAKGRGRSPDHRADSGPDSDEDGGGVRPFWSGTITFGLVSVPVDFYPAARPRRASVRMLGPGGHPLSRRYVCAADGKALSGDDLVRGYPAGDGRFVLVSDDELTALAPDKTRDIDLSRFVDESAIDPSFFDRPYILAPAKRTSKAYHLLAGTMERNHRAGIATFVMRGVEHPVAIFATDGVLWATTLRFADELRTPEDVGLPAKRSAPAARRREMEAAIKKLGAKEVDVSLLRDSSADDLMNLADKKRAAATDIVEVPDELREGTGELKNVVDLMAILKQRVGEAEAAGADKRRKPARPSPARRHSRPTKPTKKRPPKKPRH